MDLHKTAYICTGLLRFARIYGIINPSETSIIATENIYVSSLPKPLLAAVRDQGKTKEKRPTGAFFRSLSPMQFRIKNKKKPECNTAEAEPSK